MTLTLTRAQARRIAVAAQLLSGRPSSFDEVVHRLGSFVPDNTPYLAPSAELVLWSRLGDAFSRDDYRRALAERDLVMVADRLRPADDVALHLAEMAAWPGPDPRPWDVANDEWLAANGFAHAEVLAQLEENGPSRASDLRADFDRPWKSTGWNNDRNVGMLLLRLAERGEVAISHTEGRTPSWDLAERVYPPVDAVPLDEALRLRAERRLAAQGLMRVRRRGNAERDEVIADVGEAARVEGVRGTWRVDPALVGEEFEPRVALLSPLDGLVFDRKRMEELFEFDYALEMYKPASKRRWGFYALPVLVGDALVGKVDAESDHDAGLLRVHAVHEDRAFTRRERADVDAELESLADHLGLAVSHEG